MPALSFQGEWLDKLLSGDKQQTTRPQTGRFEVGDVVHIYNQQRGRITDKPLRLLTNAGHCVMCEREYPNAFDKTSYYAHFLGKVVVSGVYNMIPAETPHDQVVKWAIADGFEGLDDADAWFTDRYGEDWYAHAWTVIKWNGWSERYFEPRRSL